MVVIDPTCRLLEKKRAPIDASQWREKALFSVMIAHLSLHPHAFVSLPTYFMSPTFCPTVSFSTDNRQSSHAVHLLCLWRRPSESLSAQSYSFFPSFFSPHILPSCLLSLSIPVNATPSITVLLLPVTSLSASSFCYDLQADAALA